VFQLELRRGCNKVLKNDSITLSKKLYAQQRRAIRVDASAVCPLSGQRIVTKNTRRAQQLNRKLVVFGSGKVYIEQALTNAQGLPRDSPHWHSIEAYRRFEKIKEERARVKAAVVMEKEKPVVQDAGF
jgi:hypothetical protein